jgi:hypothetical protein
MICRRAARSLGCAALLVAGLTACGPRTGGEEATTEAIEQAQARLAERVMHLPGVVGLAIGLCDGKPCFKVYVVQRSDSLVAKIPARFEEYVVEIVESGEIKALDSTRRREAP